MQFHDPRKHDGEKIFVPVHGYPYQAWKVEGWSDDEWPEEFTGGSCSYADQGSREAAEKFARELMKNGDPYDGRKYQHYDVVKLTYETVAIPRTFAVRGKVE
jgi:hypothetical protein